MSNFLTIGVPVWQDHESLEKSLSAIVSSSAWQNRKSSNRELIVCVNGVTGPKDVTLRSVKG